jgi:hypothetical protein
MRASSLAAALAAAACGRLPEPPTRVVSATPEGTVPPGPVAVEIAFSGPVSPEGILDGSRVALCRGADADSVAAAASGEAGIGEGDPVLPARVALLDSGRRVRLEPERPLWPMASWAAVVGKGLRDAEGRPVVDPQGRQRAFRHAFETGDLPPGELPRVSLTEALARADSPEAGGEYAEVANLGSGPADLAGFRLAKRTAGGVQRCVAEPGAGGPIPPGGRGLLAGGAFDGRYPLPPGIAVYRCGAGALLGGLADDRPLALALESPGGALLSSLGWATAAPLCARGPLERIDPAGPDAPSNLACPGDASPGR